MTTSHLVFIFVAMTLVAIATATPLDDYVNAPDSHYNYRFLVKYKGPGVTIHVLNMTSQKWLTESVSNRPIWWHYLTIVVPDKLVYTDTAFLWVDSGHNSLKIPTPSDKFILLVSSITATTGSIGVSIKQIPNQPIRFPDDPSHKGRSEDDLVAWTWMKFMSNTSNPDILLRLPMTKAVVRGMDTVTSYVQDTLGHSIQKFVISGASKRGWAVWTSAAVDKRVVAMIPVVMDLLNMQKSLHHHYRSLGGWTFAFKPYHDLNITSNMDSINMMRLQAIIDPYVYMDRFHIPKMVVSATGDEFFLPDDSHYYYSQLPEPKYLKIVPNAEHSLVGHLLSSVQAIRAFYLSVLQQEPPPRITWTRTQTATSGKISVNMSRTPSQVSTYYAQTLDDGRRDFRLFVKGPNGNKGFPHPVFWFKSEAKKISDLQYEAEMSRPDRGWTAFFIRMTFAGPLNSTLDFTTETCIVPDTFPFPDCQGESCQGKLV